MSSPATHRPCRACGAPLRFVAGAKTLKVLPLERVRVVYRLVFDEASHEMRAEAVQSELGDLYVSHFETCPAAAARRRAR